MWFWIEDGRQCSYNGLRVLVQRVFGSLAQVVEMKQPCAITSNVAAFAMSHRVISSAIAKFHVLGEGYGQGPGELYSDLSSLTDWPCRILPSHSPSSTIKHEHDYHPNIQLDSESFQESANTNHKTRPSSHSPFFHMEGCVNSDFFVEGRDKHPAASDRKSVV